MPQNRGSAIRDVSIFEVVHLPDKDCKLVEPSRNQERIGIQTGVLTPEEASCG
jgi:hypothetical protein